jgi:hypothetical protein
MKLLLAFKSFQPKRPIVEISSENWFATGCQFGSEAGFLQATNSATKTGSLRAANSAGKRFAAGCQFGSKAGSLQVPNAVAKTGSLQVANSAAKTGLLQTTQFQQRMLIRRSRHSFGSESQFCC